MVEVPRTHSAKLLLLNLVMVGVPTNTFTMDENNLGLNPEAGLNPRTSADLEFKQLQYTSEADVSWTQEAQVGARRASQGGYQHPSISLTWGSGG